jgi:hypothetical protein
MRLGFYAALAGSVLALLLSGPAMAKLARHGHHTARPHSDRHYAQSHYNYRSASIVREEFIDTPRGHWIRPAHHFGGYEERRDSQVVENLRGDFTGGVGYGADGFIDGYGQTHYFVGSFRGMNSLPHGPYTPNRSRGRAF